MTATTHRVAWRMAFQPSYFGSKYTPPAVDARGRVYVASGDQTVYALDARTGREAWPATLGGSFSGVVRCDAAFTCR